VEAGGGRKKQKRGQSSQRRTKEWLEAERGAVEGLEQEVSMLRASIDTVALEVGCRGRSVCVCVCVCVCVLRKGGEGDGDGADEGMEVGGWIVNT